MALEQRWFVNGLLFRRNRGCHEELKHHIMVGLVNVVPSTFKCIDTKKKKKKKTVFLYLFR